MRAVFARSVLSGELLWELVVDASECWATRLKKSLWGSISGTMQNNAMRCRQVQSLGLSENGKTDIHQGLGNNVYQLQTGQAFKTSDMRFASRACLSGSFGCLKEMHMDRHALPVTLFGRAFSASTEKQFEDDAGDSQASVPGPQQSSPGGQQPSLEIPDSKPVGGPAWPNPDNAASYVLMSNIYADGDRWDEVKRINEMRLKARAWKKPGKAYVEIQAKVHEFIVGDRTHQDSDYIYEKLRKIKRHMGHIGYVPYVDLVLENRSHYDPYYKPR